MAAYTGVRQVLPTLREVAQADINIRVGVHSGPIKAAVVGMKDPRCAAVLPRCRAAAPPLDLTRAPRPLCTATTCLAAR